MGGPYKTQECDGQTDRQTDGRTELPQWNVNDKELEHHRLLRPPAYACLLTLM